jgi:hypothetical protein
MAPEEPARQTRQRWTTRKKDSAPRGVYRHRSGVWAARFTCGAGHIHKQRVGPLKSAAVRTYHDRRNRAQAEPGWCPRIEAQRERDRVRADRAREKARILFRDYAPVVAEWRRQNRERSWRTDQGRIKVLVDAFGDRCLDEITSLDIERFRDSLLTRRTKATANRYRDLLSAIYK